MYLGQIFVTYSFKHAKASVLSPISYSTILFSGLIGWLIWHHVPDLFALIGMLLVILGGTTSIILEQRKKIL